MASGDNIVLVGFMGTGKTSVGKLVAGRLFMRFVDMDGMIENKAGKTVSRIFVEDGEPAFRAMERAMVVELSSRTGLVVATGGGIVLNPDNIADFSRTGLVVCLWAEPATIVDRLKDDNTRPLLAGDDKMERLRSILEKRRPLYEAIPNLIRTDGLSAAAVADLVAEMYGRPR